MNVSYSDSCGCEQANMKAISFFGKDVVFLEFELNRKVEKNYEFFCAHTV